VRKRFARNAYTVTIVMDVWEFDLLNLQAYEKHNDNYSYILSVKDVYTKFLHLLPIKTKSGPSVVSVFRSIFHNPKYSKAVAAANVCTH